MSEEAQKLFLAIQDYISPFLSSVAGGTVGYMAAKRKINAEAVKLEAEAEAAQLDSITRHFQALIEGYESRVADLVREVDDLRGEVLALRKALDARPKPKTTY